MSADYPSSIRNFLTLSDGVDKVIANHPNYRGDEITALQTFIGAFGTGQANLTDLRNLLLNYIDDCKLTYTSVASVTVAAGKIVIADASGNCRWRKNASPVVVTWADIDTGAEASSTLYYVYVCADNSGTTFTVVISTNSSTPSGYTFYRKIGSFYNNSSGNIDEDSVTNLPDIAKFGTAQSRTDNTVYQALTDGYFSGVIIAGADISAGRVIIYSDGNADPTGTTVGGANVHVNVGVSSQTAYSNYNSFCIPVKKGNYYKAVKSSTGNAPTVTYLWTPKSS